MPFLEGGYVGVDVFFVLSGYLISGLIWEEAQHTGRFDAAAFYARRVKRLLPTLAVVLTLVAGAGWLLASPQQQGADAGAARAAALWLSNFFFAARIVDYFSAGVGSNLFLHTWSLGVEEQFYLIWPWLMLFLLGIWRWQGRLFNVQRLVTGLLLVALISLALGTYWAKANQQLAFYLMPGRAWEFAAGGLVFALREKLELPAWLAALQGRSLLNSLGWLLIVAAAVTFGKGLAYPGMYAAWPCFGAALVLLDRPELSPRHGVSRLLMQTRSLQVLGNLSYGVYLWHWPVLLLGESILGQGALVRAALVLFALLLATATYAAVERPLHNMRLRRAAWPVLVVGASTVLGLFVGLGQWQQAAARLLQSPAQARIEVAQLDVPSLYEIPGCDTWYRSADVDVCVFGPRNAHHTVVIFGDSVMAQWFPAIAEIYLTQPGWRVAVLTKSACSPTQVTYFYDKIHAFYHVCDVWRQRAIDEIVHLRPDVIFMGSTHYAFTYGQWVDGTRAVLRRLSPAAGSVILMSPSPELGFNGLDCLSAQINWPNWVRDPRTCAIRLGPKTPGGVLAALAKAATGYANTHVIDLRRAICPNGVCHAQLGKFIVYRDGQHMTATFVRSLAPELRKALPPSARPSG